MPAVAALTSFDDVARKVRAAREESRRNALIDVLLYQVAVGDHPEELVMSTAAAGGVTADRVLDSPYLQIGSLPEVVAGFERLVALGVDSIVVRASDMEATAQVKAALG